MTRFRYRTDILVGPWRGSAEKAVEDAVRARQASSEDRDPTTMRWLVPGCIEAEHPEEAHLG